jgi:hypothetical protein
MTRAVFVCVLLLIPALAAGQARESAPRPNDAASNPTQASVEKLGENLYRIGNIRVDTSRSEISVPGTINRDVTTLEFIANTRGGLKAYESALSLDTDAITFNTALILIGLNRTRARNTPTAHFDPATPDGDQVEIYVECPARQCSRTPAERLMFDRNTNSSPAGGTWVYTGSGFLPDGRYLAELDGTLVGFVHDPASIIEYAEGAGLNRYGSIVLNPNSGVPTNTSIMITVKAVRPARSR